MRLLLRNPAIVATVVAAGLWAFLVAFVPEETTNIAPRIILLTASLATIMRWGRAAFRVYLEGARQPEDAVILFAVGIATSEAWLCAWGLIYRFTDYPDWMTTSAWAAFPTYLAVVSFVLAVFSTRLEGERLSGVLSFIVAAGTALGIATSVVGHFLIAKLAWLIAMFTRLG